MVQSFYLRYYYVDMIDEVIGHMIELHLQLPGEWGWAESSSPLIMWLVLLATSPILKLCRLLPVSQLISISSGMVHRANYE